jgi:hypothetical protein
MLCGMFPPVTKMDGSLSKLTNVQHLALRYIAYCQ